VDVSADGKRARVIDYKTGKMPDTMKRKDRPLLMEGEKIQLAVYRGALAALDEFAAAESVEAEYLYLQPKDGEVKQSALAPEQLDAAFADLPRVLRVLDSRMKNGLFFARTQSLVHPANNCEYCSFQPICGKDRAWREKLKNADPVKSA
jgi:RecB family exonuclease